MEKPDQSSRRFLYIDRAPHILQTRHKSLDDALLVFIIRKINVSISRREPLLFILQRTQCINVCTTMLADLSLIHEHNHVSKYKQSLQAMKCVNRKEPTMNKLFPEFFTLALLCVASTAAMSGNPGQTYIGAQYGLISEDEPGFETSNPTAIIGRFGNFINRDISVEGRIGVGVQDDTTHDFGIDFTLDIDSILGVYAVGHLNLEGPSSLYGLIGFTRVEATASAPGFGSDTSSENGLSFGVGADIGVGNNAAINIEYIQYLNKSDVDLTALGLGFTFNY